MPDLRENPRKAVKSRDINRLSFSYSTFSSQSNAVPFVELENRDFHTNERTVKRGAPEKDFSSIFQYSSTALTFFQQQS